ncbi:MAG: energy-coupling factor transporter transmembrane component T [Lachnospiraceae bacterium]|nr:energy-coupling factor transporter transmembrane component T [Lachnospiraceae bacterium]
MGNEITLGQYYPVDSILHRLDPRTKFIGTIIYIVSLFLVKGVAGYLYVTAALAALIILSKVPFRFMLKSLRGIFFILILTVIFNLLLTPGTVIAKIWVIKITREGLTIAIKMAIRLTYLVTGSSIMTLTTTPNQLTDGMESLFMPLSKIRVPVHEIAMMMSIALRFIPILSEETDKIKKAQIARGADFESKHFIQRVKSMIPLLVPLFVSAFRRANDLAMAMEARCYHGGSGRTKMKTLRYSGRDRTAFVIEILFLAVAILFCVFGSFWI